MLKLSANRITDVGVAALVEAILKNKSYPLGVLDLSNNRVLIFSVSLICTGLSS